MAKNSSVFTATKLLVTVLVGLGMYAGGGFLLLVILIATGGFTLFGPPPTGFGATIELFLQVWIYMFPVVFIFFTIRNHEESKIQSLRKQKKRK